MGNARDAYNNRVKEIRTYVLFLMSIEQRKAVINYDKNNHSRKIIINENIRKILKANIYVICYNAVELIARRIFEDVYEELRDKNIKFDDLRDEFKIKIIKNAEKINKITDKNIKEKITDISRDIIHMTFDVKAIFNGNVDARLINKKIKEIGLAITVRGQVIDAPHLFSIKEQRNSLAHGDISFIECGQDLTMGDIISMLFRTRKYLRCLVECTENYIAKQMYMKKSH